MRAIIHTLPTCPWCDKAKRLLTLKEIEYTEVNGRFDGWATVPYIEIDGKPIGGFVELTRHLRSL